MGALQAEIEAFERMREKLEADYMGKWVLFHDRALVEVCDSFEVAADLGVRQFGRGPFLIRQIGETPLTLPASAMYHRPSAEG